MGRTTDLLTITASKPNLGDEILTEAQHVVMITIRYDTKMSFNFLIKVMCVQNVENVSSVKALFSSNNSSIMGDQKEKKRKCIYAESQAAFAKTDNETQKAIRTDVEER